MTRFCGLGMCEVDPCVFGKCLLTNTGFKCKCQLGYVGRMCDRKQQPCTANPCEGRGECFNRNGGFFCRCHAWWEGQRCEKRMTRIPYKPLSDRMLQEPFWLGLITVFVVLAFIGLVWCAKRHFPEKIEKLLTEEAERNRRNTLTYTFSTKLYYIHMKLFSSWHDQRKSPSSSIIARAIAVHKYSFNPLDGIYTWPAPYNFYATWHTKTIDNQYK